MNVKEAIEQYIDDDDEIKEEEWKTGHGPPIRTITFYSGSKIFARGNEVDSVELTDAPPWRDSCRGARDNVPDWVARSSAYDADGSAKGGGVEGDLGVPPLGRYDTESGLRRSSEEVKERIREMAESVRKNTDYYAPANPFADWTMPDLEIDGDELVAELDFHINPTPEGADPNDKTAAYSEDILRRKFEVAHNVVSNSPWLDFVDTAFSSKGGIAGYAEEAFDRQGGSLVGRTVEAPAWLSDRADDSEEE